MKHRVFIIVGALALPLIVVFAITYFAEPVGKNTEPLRTEAPEAPAEEPAPAPRPAPKPQQQAAPTPGSFLSQVPKTLEDARRMAMKRRDELLRLTQSEWEIERLSIMDRDPPKTVEAAVRRAQWRLDNLMVMTEADWPAEKNKLERRAQFKDENAQKIAEEKKAKAFKTQIEDAFKRATSKKK